MAKSFRGYALLDRRTMRRRESMQIASDDPTVDWQFTFVDPTRGDELTDPATNRTVDDVNFTEYVGQANVNEANDGVIAYNAQYPYEALAIKTPAGTLIEQDGPAREVTIEGQTDPRYMLFFNVITPHIDA